MNDNTLSLFRDMLLTQLHAAYLGARPETLHVGARAEGHVCSLDDVTGQLKVLAKKGLVESQPSPVAATSRIWKLTAKGTAYLDTEGLV